MCKAKRACLRGKHCTSVSLSHLFHDLYAIQNNAKAIHKGFFSWDGMLVIIHVLLSTCPGMLTPFYKSLDNFVRAKYEHFALQNCFSNARLPSFKQTEEGTLSLDPLPLLAIHSSHSTSFKALIGMVLYPI